MISEDESAWEVYQAARRYFIAYRTLELTDLQTAPEWETLPVARRISATHEQLLNALRRDHHASDAVRKT